MIYLNEQVTPNKLASVFFPNVQKDIEVQFNYEVESIPNNYSCEVQCLDVPSYLGIDPETEFHCALRESKLKLIEFPDKRKKLRVIATYSTCFTEVYEKEKLK